MASRRPRPRRLLLPAVLAAVLAAEITGIAIARSMTPTAPAAVVMGSGPTTAVDRGADDNFLGSVSRTAPVIRSGVDLASRQATASGHGPAASLVSPAGHRRDTTSAVGSQTSHPSASRTAAGAYHGRNHVWIPSLGINRSVQSFPCSRSRPPDAGVYRWGCAGRNNVYLLSHAWSTFRPLHDAYVRGTLRKGMKVIYADGSGRAHTYAVIWWKVVAPTTAASWAWAPLSSPGMTLQTCVGSNSQYRLMVRLDRIG